MGDDKMFVASVVGSSLQVEYEAAWQEWLHDKDYPQFEQIVSALNTKLSKSEQPAKGAAKGAGKRQRVWLVAARGASGVLARSFTFSGTCFDGCLSS